MRHTGRAALSALVLAASLGIPGCSGAALRYLGRRTVDLADCFKANVGVGVPVYLRAKATDLAVVGAGFALGYRVGWHGRYGGDLIGPAGIITDYGMPLVINAEAALPVVAAPRYHVVTFGPCFTTRGYPEGKRPGRWSRLADGCWFGVVATLGVSAQLEFNPVEFLDFLVGLTTVDLLGDDPWQPKEEGEKE